MQDSEKLDFAYKYPFSNETKEVIKSLGESSARIEREYLEKGRLRVEEALSKGVVEYNEIKDETLKTKYIISYVYARMIVSAIGPIAVNKFASAEAKRVANALNLESKEGIMHVAEELGIKLGTSDEFFTMHFTTYLEFMPKSDEYKLIHQKLSGGIVYIERYKLISLLENASRKAILVGLPIPKKDLPQEVAETAKTIKVPLEEVHIKGRATGKYAWIEKLLAHPLPDFRHRVVNLILAPYFANIKGLSEEEAVKIINQYIEKCKEVNPNTRVGESYIAYQVRYAKNKGLKPLSFEKAKELLGGIINFDELGE